MSARWSDDIRMVSLYYAAPIVRCIMATGKTIVRFPVDCVRGYHIRTCPCIQYSADVLYQE